MGRIEDLTSKIEENVKLREELKARFKEKQAQYNILNQEIKNIGDDHDVVKKKKDLQDLQERHKRELAELKRRHKIERQEAEEAYSEAKDAGLVNKIAEMNKAKDAMDELTLQLNDVKTNNKSLHKERSKLRRSNKVDITNHSVVQYLSRAEDVDIDSVKTEIFNNSTQLGTTTDSTNIEYAAGSTATASINLNDEDNPIMPQNLNLTRSFSDNTDDFIFAVNSADTEDNSVTTDSIEEQSDDKELGSVNDVTDKDVVEYLSNSGQIDLDEIEEKIVPEEIKSLILSDELIGTAGTYTNSDGYRIVVKNGAVVTFLPKKSRSKYTAKGKSRKQSKKKKRR